MKGRSQGKVKPTDKVGNNWGNMFIELGEIRGVKEDTVNFGQGELDCIRVSIFSPIMNIEIGYDLIRQPERIVGDKTFKDTIYQIVSFFKWCRAEYYEKDAGDGTFDYTLPSANLVGKAVGIAVGRNTYTGFMDVIGAFPPDQIVDDKAALIEHFEFIYNKKVVGWNKRKAKEGEIAADKQTAYDNFMNTGADMPGGSVQDETAPTPSEDSIPPGFGEVQTQQPGSTSGFGDLPDANKTPVPF